MQAWIEEEEMASIVVAEMVLTRVEASGGIEAEAAQT